MILAIAFTILLVCSEWWLVAGLALFWCYVYAVGVSQEGVLDRTKGGAAWVCLGAVVLALFPDGPGWWAGAGMIFWGWGCLAREPLWET